MASDRVVTIWHFKAELLHQEEQIATYRFFPDHVMAPAVAGVFRVDLRTYKAEVIKPADAEAKGLVSTDARCVAALVYKIRRAVEDSGQLPDRAFFIA